ncbi:hypothetical protein PAHAL_1G142000 [Panicum hallii]|uniref:Uncharacterized protein n=1 Tax=Panicum hallii TaxID=206008 RepID=A0A2T8KV70_9POAL|nr:hypothetical protein PAHAL_1G142000 [Panicum hallii]
MKTRPAKHALHGCTSEDGQLIVFIVKLGKTNHLAKMTNMLLSSNKIFVSGNI